MQLSVEDLNTIVATHRNSRDDCYIQAYCFDDITYRSVLLVKYAGHITPVPLEDWKSGAFPVNFNGCYGTSYKQRGTVHSTRKVVAFVVLEGVQYVVYTDASQPEATFCWMQTLEAWNAYTRMLNTLQETRNRILTQKAIKA